ncbi:unannotated protein [freshwater metagenome]|uniref:Unannotated protein n=1 Tax=freshwater metagenome TaxID=449393 RepID=A0A6J6BP62_9ZZZZ|nr:hypothetical protein [Actinomycetota bacterium]
MEPTQPPPVAVPPPPPAPPMPPLPPTTAPGFSGQPPQPPRRKRHVGLIITAIVLTIAILGGATVGIVAFTRSSTSANKGEIFLEEANSLGTNPFGNLPGPAVAISATSTTTNMSTTTSGVVSSGQTVNAATRGLYGGSLDSGRCDPEAQIAFLNQNRSIADAFVAALNRDQTLQWSGGNKVTREQLPGYVRELTSVTLVRDTRVTNHGYRNGRATDIQSVLQAGTAVMVDRYGVPRIKCNCGNPLTPPVAVTVTPVYTGPQWPAFNPASIVVVNQTTVVIDVFVITNLTGPGFIDRTAGATGVDTPGPPPVVSPNGQTLGTGDVQITLQWTGDCDLDLHVTDPSGAQISYGSPTSPTGGALDIDDIPNSGSLGNHIENVFWGAGTAPRGEYQTFANGYGAQTSTTCPYTLGAFVNGHRVAGSNGQLSQDQNSPVAAFTF